MPWHQAVWHHVCGRVLADRLPHGLLLQGPSGVGKGALAERIAASLLCQSRDAQGEACGTCHGCRLRAGNAHPDLRHTRAEKNRSGIRVEQVRALQHFINLSSQYGRYRVVILPDADALNLNAANALLKTLEEPPSRAVLILASDRPARLPATIRSRCQALSIHPPDTLTGRRWLADMAPDAAPLLGLSGGAPLRAMELAAEGGEARYTALIERLAALHEGRLSPVEAAPEWQDVGRTAFMELVQIALGELQRCAAGGTDSTRGPRTDALPQLAAQVDWVTLQAFYELVTRWRAAAEQPLNAQLMAEAVFAEWVEYTRNRKRGIHGPAG